MTLKELLIGKFRTAFLQNVCITKEDIPSLWKCFGIKRYPRKKFLLRAGDKWDKIVYIHEGLIRLFYNDFEGREFNKAFFWENHCLWPVAPRDRNEESLFNISALEDVIALECSFQLFFEFLMQRGQWEKFALPVAEKLVEQKFLREHNFLLLSATERYVEFANDYPELISRIPDYHLASFLGITNVTLSRIKCSLNS